MGGRCAWPLASLNMEIYGGKLLAHSRVISRRLCLVAGGTSAVAENRWRAGENIAHSLFGKSGSLFSNVENNLLTSASSSTAARGSSSSNQTAFPPAGFIIMNRPWRPVCVKPLSTKRRVDILRLIVVAAGRIQWYILHTNTKATTSVSSRKALLLIIT